MANKPGRKRKANIVVQLPRPMSFEDAVRHVLKAKPVPKKPRKR